MKVIKMQLNQVNFSDIFYIKKDGLEFSFLQADHI